MRYLYLVLSCLLAHLAGAQAAPDSLATADADSARYQLATDERRVSSETDSLGNCIEVLQLTGSTGLVRSYYPSGHLHDYLPYGNLVAGRLHGVATTWYENGQLQTMQTFLHGRRDSTLSLYYEDGRLKRQTRYTAGNELPGRCFDAAGNAVPYFLYEQPPLYPGGQGQLSKELSQLIGRHVPRVLRFLTNGVFYFNFQVLEDGRLGKPQVTVVGKAIAQVQNMPASETKKYCQQILEYEASTLTNNALAALVKINPHFYPGKRDGELVRWNYRLEVPFQYQAWPVRQPSYPSPDAYPRRRW